jgi:hypothetical protein
MASGYPGVPAQVDLRAPALAEMATSTDNNHKQGPSKVGEPNPIPLELEAILTKTQFSNPPHPPTHPAPSGPPSRPSPLSSTSRSSSTSTKPFNHATFTKHPQFFSEGQPLKESTSDHNYKEGKAHTARYSASFPLPRATRFNDAGNSNPPRGKQTPFEPQNTVLIFL